MSPVRQTTIRELKHATTRVLAMVESGEAVEVCRRRRPVAILPPPGRGKAAGMPDFAARLEKICGDRELPVTGADLIGAARGER